MSFIKSSDFYRVYFLEFWSHKLSLLNHSYYNLEDVYPKVKDGLPESSSEMFKSFLKVEIHTTYFSLVETLFTLIYLLNTGNEKDLWCRLAKSKIDFNALETIAKPFTNNDFSFFSKDKKIKSGNTVTFLDFLFFRGLRITDENKKAKAHSNIKKLFAEMAQDLINRSSHNAIKHSMRAIEQKFSISFDESIPEINEDVVFENSIFYLEKALDDKKIKIVVEKTDFDRDYNRASAAFCLISNIVKTREKMFFGLEKFDLFPFFEDDVEKGIGWKDDPKFKSIEIEHFETDICK
jgi:chemotaxis protein CheY-P-specific phosphatase CheC